MKRLATSFAAAAGGFALSFLGLGLLWIGVPWAYQSLMFFAFFLLSFAVTRARAAGDDVSLFVIYGALPLGALISLFRDKNDSHLMPILIVCAWLAGALLGRSLAVRLSRKAAPPG